MRARVLAMVGVWCCVRECVGGEGMAGDAGTGSQTRIEVLGPWRVVIAGRPVEIPAGQMRVLLAALAVSAGSPVPLDVLVVRLWPGRSPMRERATIHTYVARLRRLLGRETIETTPVGYQLMVEPGHIDLWLFKDLLRRAAEAPAGEELALLRAALALWRGEPFAEVASDWLSSEVTPPLTQLWLAALERRIDLEMRSDRIATFVPQLRALAEAHPTRESLWLRLIEALHRSSLRAEALEAFQQVRSMLTDELGIEPGAALQELHLRILRDGALDPPPEEAPCGQARAVRQLPPEAANFVGRAELAPLDRVAARLGRDNTTAPGRPDGRRLTHIVALDGAAGIGKTTLAVHWAHRMAAMFPDVQLYVNLRGYGPGTPVSPAAAVETVLRGLGVRGELIPVGVEERAALLRSTLAGRSVLMLLDNARDAEQVRPLLPGGDSLVIVTSRSQLRGLSVREGAHRLTLGPLPPHEALALLSAAVGADRVRADGEAAAQLVALCDGLPLALVIVAERAQRVGGLTEVVQALRDERARLDIFSDGDGDPYNDLWVALSWSYRALSPDAASMFRRLGQHPADDISLAAAAALAGVPQRHAAQALDRLVAAHLVQRRAHRYGLHDLVRWYARELAGRDDNARERTEAIECHLRAHAINRETGRAQRQGV
jgi:DNA-binding SARP family transcriptional activator